MGSATALSVYDSRLAHRVESVRPIGYMVNRTMTKGRAAYPSRTILCQVLEPTILRFPSFVSREKPCMLRPVVGCTDFYWR